MSRERYTIVERKEDILMRCMHAKKPKHEQHFYMVDCFCFMQVPDSDAVVPVSSGEDDLGVMRRDDGVHQSEGRRGGSEIGMAGETERTPKTRVGKTLVLMKREFRARNNHNTTLFK